jgi:hypothetical protein
MSLPITVRPVHLQGERAAHARSIRHPSDTLQAGEQIDVLVSGRWRHGLIVRIASSTVHVLLRPR